MAAPGGPSVASEAPVVGVAAFALQTPATEAPSAKSRKPKPTDPTPDEQRVFDHWREKLQHPRATLDAKRLAKIRAALKTHGLERCLRAVDGIATSDWHRTNKQDDIELVLRDASHIEKYEAIALPLKPALRVVQTGPRPETPSERIERLKREFAAAANKDAANG